MDELSGKVEKIATRINKTVQATIVELGEDDEFATDSKQKFRTMINRLSAVELGHDEFIKCLDKAKKHQSAENFKKEYRNGIKKIAVDMSKSNRVKEFEVFLGRAYQRDFAEACTEGMTVTETVQRTDPFTKRPMVNPVRHKTCNHVYDRESLENIISLNANVRCPYVGCTNKNRLRMVDVTDDVRLKMTLQTEEDDSEESD